MPRVLVLEDETLIAQILEDWLVELGFEVVGPASTVRDALQLIEHSDLDAAIVDVRLADGDSQPAAELLRSRSVPFVLASGRAGVELGASFKDVPRLSKPFDFDQFQTVLENLTAK